MSCVPILQDIHFELHPGELVVLVGPNGAKSTFAASTGSGFKTPDTRAVLAE